MQTLRSRIAARLRGCSSAACWTIGVALCAVSALAIAQTTSTTPTPPAADTSTVPVPSTAVPAPPIDARDLSETDRKAYAQTIKEARELITNQRYDEAIAKLDQLSAQRPREAQARFLKGVALTDQDKTEQAAIVFRELIADYPEMPEPRNNLAVLYAKRGELAQAREELELAIHAAPDYAVAHENLGDIYARLAADEYARAAELDKRNKSAPAKLKLARAVIVPSP
jgi:tetratricopeptide (TPR) repeat protein